MTATILEAPTMTTREHTHAPELAPLGAAWKAAIAVIGVAAVGLALGGMILSFRAVSREMFRDFGTWSWLVPIVADLSVFVFSGVDLLLEKLDMPHFLARWTVYGATFGTVYLNYKSAETPAGRVAHVLMPAVWVAFVELMRHIVRRLAKLANGTRREPIPAVRWLLAPWPTMKLWRRMILWDTNSYKTALASERVRLARIAAVRGEHGRLWRWRVSALDRLSIGLAEPVTLTDPTGQSPDADRTQSPDTPPVIPPATGQPGPDTPTGQADSNDRSVRTPRPDKPRTTPPVTRRPVDPDKPQRASLPELIVACQEYAVRQEKVPEHLTRAEIKDAAKEAGYSVSNDRVTKIAEFFDEKADGQ